MDDLERLARNHGTGGWQTLEDMVRFGRAVQAAERKRQIGLLKARLDGAVMSKYATKAECEAAREALRNAMLDAWGA